MITAKPFYMIRHGESVANRDGYFSGNLDVELTNTGKEQAEKARLAVEALEIKPLSIIHSHLSRARNTAKIINTNLDIPMFETPLVGEHRFGDWEKEPWETVRPRFDGGENPPNGETHEEFSNRVKEGINFSLKKDGPVLIACHGGVFKGFSYLYNRKMHDIKNCALYSFKPIDDDLFPWEIKLIE
jgi:probable phosphoglycerate mutase